MKPSSGPLSLGIPLAVAAATYFLWATPVVWPVKIFVVFLHELSHGLAAVATGGSIVRMELSAAESGVCVTAGGSPFVVLSAGYLGSLLLGALLLVAGTRSRHDRLLLTAVGVGLLAVTLVWVRSLFGFVWGLGAGSALLMTALWLGDRASDLVLRTLGVVSMLYAVWDIASDTVVRSIPGSDAHALGELTGIPGTLWGLFWIGLSLAIGVAVLRSLARTADR